MVKRWRPSEWGAGGQPRARAGPSDREPLDGFRPESPAVACVCSWHARNCRHCVDRSLWHRSVTGRTALGSPAPRGPPPRIPAQAVPGLHCAARAARDLGAVRHLRACQSTLSASLALSDTYCIGGTRSTRVAVAHFCPAPLRILFRTPGAVVHMRAPITPCDAAKSASVGGKAGAHCKASREGRPACTRVRQCLRLQPPPPSSPLEWF